MGGDVAGEEFEARGEAHDEEKKLDEAALVATAAAAKRNLPPIWPPGSREGNVAKWDACRRVLDEAELAADLAEAELAAAGGACTSRRNTTLSSLRLYSNTKPRGRGTRNRAAAELLIVVREGRAVIRRQPVQAEAARLGATEGRRQGQAHRRDLCGYRYPQLGRNSSAVVIPLRGAALQVGWQSQFPTRSPLRVR